MKITKDKLVEYKNRVTKFAKEYEDEIITVAVFAGAAVGILIATRTVKKMTTTAVAVAAPKVDVSDILSKEQSVYSVFGSPLQLILDDGLAERYNSFIKEFLDAQVRYEGKHGKLWQPHQALPMNTSAKDLKAYHAVGKLMNHLIAVNGGSLDLPEAQCVSDFLEKLT
jgi:hypothetical protein